MNKLAALALIAIFLIIGSEYAKADDCDEDDLTDYSAHHLLVVCTPVTGGYAKNPYYKGGEKCGAIKWLG